MSAGLLYEPRSLWSIANQTVLAGTTSETVTPLTRNHFWNGTRWPIILDRVAMCGVGYVFSQAPGTQNAADSVVNRVKLAVSAPQRYHLSSKHLAQLGSIMPRPRMMPPTGDSVATGNFPVSSLWGQSMLRFEEPIRIPKDGDIQWSLSAMVPYSIPGQDTPPVAQVDPVDAWMLYQETGGLFDGSARAHLAQLHTLRLGHYPPDGEQTEERWPYPDDGLNSTSGGDTNNFWDPRGEFTARRFKDQNPIRDGAGEFTEMRVMIDQRDYDDRLQTSQFSGFRPAPISTRVGCRVRTSNCGSNAWWWRPGAPLALVFDEITPAIVYKLHRPITLGPGDTLDLQMTFPANLTQLTQIHHVGVSFNGFSPVQG